MTVTRIAKQSGALPEFVLNTALKLSLGPELSGGIHLQRSRRSLDRWGASIPPVPGVSITQQTLAGMHCEIHLPQHAPSNRVMLYMHGGGYAVGSPLSHRRLVSRLAKATGIKAICFDYRRAPEHPFPAALADATRLYQYCLDQGIRPSNIVFCGDSAGGNLVLATLLKLKQDGLPLPAAASGISPWCDLTLQADTIQGNAHKDLILSPALVQQFADHYVPETRRRDPLVSPLFGELSGLPPLLIQVGSNEILLGDAIAMAEKARQAGVEVELEIWEDMHHVWHYSAFLLKDGRAAIRHIAAFFERCFSVVSG